MSDSTQTDCATLTSCTQCVSSQLSCDWCIDGVRCTNNTAQDCQNDLFVIGVNGKGPIYRTGPTFCPSIKPNKGDESEILVAANSKKSIEVKVRATGEFTLQTRFYCKFTIEGNVTFVQALVLRDTLFCDPMEFIYASQSPTQTATFDVVWSTNPKKSFDNPHNIHVVMYKCPEMADNCSSCLAQPEKFNCGWCSVTNMCEVENQCSTDTENKLLWLNRKQTCPTSEI